MVGSTKAATVDHRHRAPMDGRDDLSLVYDHHLAGQTTLEEEGEEEESSSSGVSCSICLDVVSDNGGRSTAKLHCGHQFHLDCIGSAFNMKGAMQCPNCRKVEKGQWLYANGSSRPLYEFSMDDWIPDEDFYDLSYSEMPYGIHWCPFGDLSRFSSFEEVESPPSTTYHELRGLHSVYAEHSTTSSATHSYVAYLGVGPIPPASSRSNDNSIDDPNFNNHWNGFTGHHEIFNRHTQPAMNIQYHHWGHHSPPFSISSSHINSADPASGPPMTLRSSSGELDTRVRSTNFPPPVPFGSGSGPAAASSYVSSIVPRHPGNAARASERIHTPRALRHRRQSGHSLVMPTPIIQGTRRFDGPRGIHRPQHEHNGGFLIIPPNSSGPNLHEVENALPNHFHAWEREQMPPFPPVSIDRDPGWHSFHQNAGGSDPSNSSSSFCRYTY